MEHPDLLQTIAEVGATLAGFAGVISIFRRQIPEPELLVLAHSARNIIEAGLGVVLFSFAPPVIHGLGASPDTAWRLSSALAALALIVWQLFNYPRLQHVARTVAGKSAFTFEPGLAIPATLIGMLTLTLLAGNAGGLFEQAPTVYVLSLLGPLVVTGMIFVRLIIMAGRSS